MKRLIQLSAVTTVILSGFAALAYVFHRWDQLGGSGACVSSIANGWAIGCSSVNAGGNGVYYWSNSAWHQVNGAGAVQITTDENQNPWVVNAQGNVYYWNGTQFVLFSSPGPVIVAVAVGNPNVTHEIWAVSNAGNIFVNSGTQSSPGVWAGGPNGNGWGPAEIPKGIAVFTLTGSGCGTHVPFFVGKSQQIYQFTGSSCDSYPGWTAVSGAFAGNSSDLLYSASIATDLVITTNGDVYAWDAGFFPLAPGVPGGNGHGSVGVGGVGNQNNSHATFSFNSAGSPYQLDSGL